MCPPIAALGASIATAATAAASAVTLTGLATGAAIVGTGFQLVGMATGSKTLQKIGTGFSIASGVGFAANGARSLMGASSVTGTASRSKGLLNTDNIDDMLSTPIKGKNTQGLRTFDTQGGMTKSMDSFKNDSKLIGSGSAIGKTDTSFDPELEKSYFQRANETLTKYNPMMNMLGGMGEAYMINESMDLRRGLLDKQLDFDQQNIDRINRNNGTPLNLDPSIGLTRNTNAYAPLLRMQ